MASGDVGLCKRDRWVFENCTLTEKPSSLQVFWMHITSKNISIIYRLEYYYRGKHNSLQFYATFEKNKKTAKLSFTLMGGKQKRLEKHQAPT